MPSRNISKMQRSPFSKQIEKFHLILLSPWLRQRNRVLAQVIEWSAASAFYVVSTPRTELRSFMQGLLGSLREYYPNFGHETEAALARPKGRIDALAQALIVDLAESRPSLRRLIIDNADYLTLGQDEQQFFEALLKGCPSDFKLFVNGRTLPHRFWADFIHTGQAVLLEDDAVLGTMFTSNNLNAPHLEVYALGIGSVLVDGVPVQRWDGPLPRDLFYYLLDHPMVTRDEIFEIFWPGLSVIEATNVFHVTKRKVSETLGCELTTYSSGFYRPSGQVVIHYDVHVFEAALKTASSSEDRSAARMGYQQAVQLYRVPFLYGMGRAWVNQRRDQLKLDYVEALVSLARLYQAEGQDELALSSLLRAQREVPFREDICRDIMLLYQKRGQMAQAAAYYEAFALVLKRTLRIEPSVRTREVYREMVEAH